MRIAVISDIHDNIWALAKVMRHLRGCDVLCCLGDICSPFTLATIGEQFAGQVHVVWGNNDGDKLLLTRNAEQAGNIVLHGFFADLEIDRRRIALNHYPEIAEPLAASGQYHLVCHGHDHKRQAELLGPTWLLNPGEVMGRFGVISYGVYDTALHQAEIISL